ncbi:MAG: hypothetical protein LBC99_08660 [Spirochaetota bacterium]|jgi:hypothetical protein|nr:hypothetical protein [Spirochaetota bacterium]
MPGHSHRGGCIGASEKALIAFIFVVCLSFPVFAEETDASDRESSISSDSPAKPWQESGTAFGLEFGNFWGKSNNVKTHTTSVAYHMRQYFTEMWGRVGYFSYASLFGFPYVDTRNGERPGYIDYHGRQIRIAVGFFLDHAFNEKWSLFYGVGSQFSYTRERYARYISLTNGEEDFDRRTFNGGMIADIALRYARGNIIVLAGSIFSCEFVSWVALKSSHSALNTTGSIFNGANEAKGFSMFGVQPYFSIGFRS